MSKAKEGLWPVLRDGKVLMVRGVSGGGLPNVHLPDGRKVARFQAFDKALEKRIAKLKEGENLCVAMKDGWYTVGNIGVDAALCWIGDPCYVPKDLDAKLESAELLNDSLAKVFPIPGVEQAAFGICVQTGGDGIYPVKIKVKNGYVDSVVIEFQAAVRRNLHRDQQHPKYWEAVAAAKREAVRRLNASTAVNAKHLP